MWLALYNMRNIIKKKEDHFMKSSKHLWLFLLSALCLLSLDFAAWAAEGIAGGQASAESVNYFVWTVAGASFGLAIAAAACGIAQSIAVRQGLEGIARQPEAAGSIQTAMILGLAFIESLVIYVLLVALILLFVNPFAKHFVS
jgi:F-type H+-transporting ATPase subunit c